MIMEITTGTLLWLGYGRGLWVEMHMWGTWIILGYTAAHVLAHFALGGVDRLAPCDQADQARPAAEGVRSDGNGSGSA